MSIDFADDPRGVQLRLLVERLKYERYVQSEAESIVEAAFNKVVDTMLSPAYRTLTAAQKARTLALFRELDRIIKAGYVQVANLHLTEMPSYAQLEADVARSQVAGILPSGSAAAAAVEASIGARLPKAYLTAIAKLPIQGLAIGQWFEAQAQTMSRETRRIIQQGLIEGKGNAEITRRILAPARTEGAVLSRRAKNDARIISRTTVNAVQNSASMASYAQLPASVSDSYAFVAVLDRRTSLQCAAASGRVFRYDDPKRLVPPLHPNCRSSTLPLIRGAETTMTAQRSAPSMRNYADWLTDQPASIQNEILGATRAGLFRDGRMSLSDAVDADNRVLTLPQLRESLGLTALTAK